MYCVCLPIFLYSLYCPIYSPTITVTGLVSAIYLTGTSGILVLFALVVTFNPLLPIIDRKELCLLDSIIPRFA